MGSAASVGESKLQEFTAGEVGNAVAALGTAYESYKATFCDNGVDGEMVSAMTDDEFNEFADELGVTSKLHRKKILMELKKWQAPLALLHTASPVHSSSSPSATVDAAAAPATVDAAAAPATVDAAAAAPVPIAPAGVIASKSTPEPSLGDDFVLGDKVTRDPRSIMEELFALQGIFYDRAGPEEALEKICNFVGVGGCDGVNSFDVFISYRVAADKDAAQLVYQHLHERGVFCFLDSKCLVDGMPWKEGFMQGLRNSRMILCLMSDKGLEPVRDHRLDHTGDNMLLEYETALRIRSTSGNPSYCCPVLIGGPNKGKPFGSFDLKLYPDCVTRKLFKCKYTIQRFHRCWFNNDDGEKNWKCCYAKKKDPGCKQRKLSAKDVEELERGIIRYHPGEIEMTMGILCDDEWSCCKSQKREVPGCRTRDMTSEEYMQFLNGPEDPNLFAYK